MSTTFNKEEAMKKWLSEHPDSKREKCRIDGCTATEEMRGVCQSHYLYILGMRKKGEVTEEELVEKGIFKQKFAKNRRPLREDILRQLGRI